MGYALALAYESADLVGAVAFAVPLRMMWLALRQYTARAGADLQRLRTAESALRSSEERYRSLVETTTRGLFVVDRAGRIQCHNQRFAEIVGEPGTLIGRELTAFVEPEGQEAIRAALGNAGASVQRLEVSLPSGPRGTRLLTLSLSEYARGTQVLGGAEDITERRAIEKRGRQAQHMDSVGEMAAGISHDFNNLLTVIQANISEAAQAAGPESVPLLRAAEEATRSAAELSQQMLAVGRASDAVRRPLRLRSPVEKLCALLSRTIDPNIRLINRVPPEICVLASSAQLQHVLINLTVNACEAMPRSSRTPPRCRPNCHPGPTAMRFWRWRTREWAWTRTPPHASSSPPFPRRAKPGTAWGWR